MSVRRYSLPVLLLAAGLGLSGAAGAAAISPAQLSPDERAQGQWYMTKWFNFDKLSERGATGKGVKIAVIDTALNPDVPELAGANIQVMGSTCMDPGTGKPWEAVNTDPALSAHGTNVVAMLVGNGVAGDGGPGARGIVPEAEIMFYGTAPVEPPSEDGRKSYWDSCVLNDPTVKPGEESLLSEAELDLPFGPSDVIDNSDGEYDAVAATTIQLGDSTALAARAAIRDGADVISLSIDSGDTIRWDGVLIHAQRAGVPVVIGTRNPTDNLFEGSLTNSYQSNGIVAVNAVEQDGSPLRGGAEYEAGGASNLAVAAPGRDLLGVGVADAWGPELIHGTSYATPLVAGTIALGLQVYPDATAFQVLQAMIRTTGDGKLKEPVWKEKQTGYGFANPGGMLNIDPTEFPDENPLFVTSVKDPRCTFPEEDGGYPGSEDETGYWDCYWSTTPTPKQETEYWAAVDGAAETPGGAGRPAGEEAGVIPVWMVVAGGLGLLVIIGVAVLVPVLVTRSRKRAALQHPQHPPYAQQISAPQQIPQAQVQQPGAYPHPDQRPGQPGAPNSGDQL